MIITELIYNLSVLVTLSILSGFIDSKYSSETNLGKIFQGILFGVAAVIAMLTPFVLAEGFIIDGRSIVISLCTLFFGPISGITSSMIAIIFRYLLGGGGALTGSLIVLSSFLSGYIFFWLYKIEKITLNKRTIYLFGLLVSTFMMIVLFSLPKHYIPKAFYTLTFTVIVFFPLITLLIGKILLDQRKNMAVMNNLYLIFENLSDAVFVHKMDGKIIIVNNEACKQTGYTREELLSSSIENLHSQNDYGGYRSLKSRVSKNAENVERFEVRYKRKNGSLYNAEVSICSIVINNEKVGLDQNVVLKVVKDITDQKIAESEIRSREAKFRNLFENHSAIKFIIDAETGDIVNANKAASKFYGWSIEELEKMNITPINTSAKEEFLEKMRQSSLNDKSRFEFSHIKADGSFADMEVFSSLIQIDGKDFLHAILHDITAKKKIERELIKHSLAIEQSPVSIVITDVNGNIEYVNPMFSKITGYTFEEVQGENPRILKSGKQSDEFYKGMWQTITSGNIWAGVLHNKKKSGELFWESAIISPIKNEKEIITNFIAVKEDITEDVKRDEELKNYRENLEQLVKQRTGELDTVNKELKLQLDRSKILEKQLQESLSKEKEINELKTRFIATVSHEFRTPLSALLSSSQMIQRYSKNWSEEKLKQHYNRIESTVKYLTHILDDVLTISRADREILKNNPELCDINDLLNSFVEDIKPQLTEKHQLILDINCSKDEINIDRNLLRHIIINLLSNAVKYSPNGSIVNLTAKCSEEEIIISISDQGLGISENEIKYIFDPFFRANNSVGIQGTGLGLNIVKRALEILKGEISVESKENVGTTFFVNIPIDNYEQ